MDYKSELVSLQKKVERKKHLESLTKVLEDKYYELSEKIQKLKKRKKQIVEYEKKLAEYEAVKKELKQKEDELLNYKDSEKEYDRLIKEYVQAVKEKNGDEAKKISEIEVKLNRLEKKKKEIINVYNEGYTAFDLSRDVVKALDKARKWGWADIFGGSWPAASERLEYLKEAEGYKVELILQLTRYQEGVASIEISKDLIEISSLAGESELWVNHIHFDTTDLLFEFGIDYVIQKKILKARKSAIKICGELKDSLYELKRLVDTIKMDYNNTQNKLADMLISMK